MSEQPDLKVLKDLQAHLKESGGVESLKLTEEGKVQFGKSEYDQSTKTAFIIDNKKEFYTIGSLVLFFFNKDKHRAAYFKEATLKKLEKVKQNDRKAVLSFFNGEDLSKIPSIKISKTLNPAAKSRHKSNNKRKLIDFWDAQEQPMSTVTSILRGKVDFGNLLRDVIDKYHDGAFEKSLEKKKQQNIVGGKIDGKKVFKALPIIIVPPLSGVVNIDNVQSFLEKGELKDKKEDTKVGEGAEVFVHRKKEHLNQNILPNDYDFRDFRIVSNVNKLEKKEFDQVVAVFVQGPKWQFKNFPFKTEADLFQNILGLYVHFDGDVVHPNVQQWNVKCFKVKKQTRNMDQIQCHRVWEAIDNFVLHNKSELIN